MKETIATIPLMNAFHADDECPFCYLEREAEQRRRDFTGFTLDAARMALAKPDCMVQHPLPAHRGEEIAPDVLEAHADEIFDEAENRIYVEKAVLAVLLAGK